MASWPYASADPACAYSCRTAGAWADPSGRASEWERLTTSSERALAPILAGYGQIVVRPTGSQAAGLGHRLRIFLIDPQQRIWNIYGLDFLDPQLLLADVRAVLLEREEARRLRFQPTVPRSRPPFGLDVAAHD